MLETYATFKVLGDYIIPLGLLILFLLFITINHLIDIVIWKFKIKLLKIHGFETHLEYKIITIWENKSLNLRFSESDLKRISCRKLKQQIKSREG